MTKTFLQKLIRDINTTWFFRTTLLLFILEAVWLAATSNYPMAFDESYHFGLIQFFSHHLNPIVQSQPSSTYGLGAIPHNPSFLYHYLMSFPYRLVAHYTSDLKTQIISLRLINVGLMTMTLIVMRKMLCKLALPQMLNNLIMLVFALTPIVTVLAAQINYDNLNILLCTVAIYQAIVIVQSLEKKAVPLMRTISLMCLCLFASLVKFTFLPIFLGVVIVLVWKWWAGWHEDKRQFKAQLAQDYERASWRPKILLLGISIFGSGLFATYYGMDIIKYHNIVPQCHQVLTVSDCEQYYAWDRNWQAAQYKKAHPNTPIMNPVRFTLFWFKVEYYQLFGEIIPTGGLVYIAHTFYIAVMTLSALAAVCAIATLRTIMKRYRTVAVTTIILVCTLIILWLRNYHDYRQLGQPFGIQGRYLIPTLLYMYVLFGLGIAIAAETKRVFRMAIQLTVAVIVVASFTYFGGYIRYASNISPRDGWPKTTSHMAAIPKTNHRA